MASIGLLVVLGYSVAAGVARIAVPETDFKRRSADADHAV
jgi:hypothetical protein